MSDTEAIKGKAPAFQYYPSDWLNDQALQSCSLYARGLWHEMLSRMWQGEPQGHLTLNGRAMSTEQLARLSREPLKLVKAALEELKGAGVYSETDDGVIVSRRMVRDVHNRKVRAEGGKLGGNPALKCKGKDKQKDNLPPNLGGEVKDNQKPTPSSSSSSSLEHGDKSPRSCAEGAAGAGDAEARNDWERRELAAPPVRDWTAAMRRAWLEWLRHLTAKFGRPSPEQLGGHLRTLRELADDETRAAWLREAIDAGLRKPAEPRRNGAKKAEVIADASDAARDELHTKGF